MNNLNITGKNLQTRKAYKSCFTIKNRIFPGDPMGLPDDFFSKLFKLG